MDTRIDRGRLGKSGALFRPTHGWALHMLFFFSSSFFFYSFLAMGIGMMINHWKGPPETHAQHKRVRFWVLCVACA